MGKGFQPKNKRVYLRRYKTPEEFWSACERYFEMCDAAVDKKTGKPEPEQYTMTGLALALGFSSLQELYNYSEYDETAEVAERARLKVINAYEKRLQKAQCVGSIFALKNFGWRDERHIEQNVKGAVNTTTTHTFDFSKMSTGAMSELFAAMKQADDTPDDHPVTH